MTDYLTENQTNKLALLSEIKKVVSEIHFQPMDLRPVEIAELDRTLYSLHGYCGLAAKETTDDLKLNHELLSLQQAISDLRKRFLLGNSDEASQKLAEFQQALFKDVRDTFEAIRNQDDRERLTESDLPAALHNRFIGVNGKYLIQVYPKQDAWNRQAQEEFIKELRTIDPDVTGTPIQLYEYTGLLKKSFQQAAWYSLVAIAILVFVHFRQAGTSHSSRKVRLVQSQCFIGDEFLRAGYLPIVYRLSTR